MAGIRYSDDLYGVRATINAYEPKVKKGSKDISQSGVLIDNGPKSQEEAVGACYSVAPNSTGDTFARFHVVWVINNISSFTHYIIKYNNFIT